MSFFLGVDNRFESVSERSEHHLGSQDGYLTAISTPRRLLFDSDELPHMLGMRLVATVVESRFRSGSIVSPSNSARRTACVPCVCSPAGFSHRCCEQRGRRCGSHLFLPQAPGGSWTKKFPWMRWCPQTVSQGPREVSGVIPPQICNSLPALPGLHRRTQCAEPPGQPANHLGRRCVLPVGV